MPREPGIHAPEQKKTTYLMYASSQGDIKAVQHILHVQPNSAIFRDRTLKTALHYCAGGGSDSAGLAHCADLLVMAAPSLVETRDEDGFTPLHLAVISGNMQLVHFLLANGADVNALDAEKHSVVHWATVCGETAALGAVLSAGAEISTPDVHGGFPLHYAAQMCGSEKEQLGLQVLHILLGQPSASVAAEDNDGRQPLLWAASAGSARAVLALVRAGAAVEAPDKDGLTALHCAASRGHTDCLDTLLTLCGATPDVIDSNGCTALHYSVTLGHADATALLLAHGADPNRQDRKGRSPAHCGCAKGQLETVKQLGAQAANLWLRNARGDLPLHEAAASGRRQLVRWLLDQRPSQVNARNNDGRCPLHLAALNDNADMCKILLDAGAQVNPILRTSKNIFMTPLDCALQRGFRSTAKFLQLHGGIPATRLSSSSTTRISSEITTTLPNHNSKLQIKEDITLIDRSSSETDVDNSQKQKKRKSIRRRVAYRYEKTRNESLSDGEVKEKGSRKSSALTTTAKHDVLRKNGDARTVKPIPVTSNGAQFRKKKQESDLDSENESTSPEGNQNDSNIKPSVTASVKVDQEELAMKKEIQKKKSKEKTSIEDAEIKEEPKNGELDSNQLKKTKSKESKKSDTDSSVQRKKSKTSEKKKSSSSEKSKKDSSSSSEADAKSKGQSSTKEHTINEELEEAQIPLDTKTEAVSLPEEEIPKEKPEENLQKSADLLEETQFQSDQISLQSKLSEDIPSKTIVVEAAVHEPPKEIEEDQQQQVEEGGQTEELITEETLEEPGQEKMEETLEEDDKLTSDSTKEQPTVISVDDSLNESGEILNDDSKDIEETVEKKVEENKETAGDEPKLEETGDAVDENQEIVDDTPKLEETGDNVEETEEKLEETEGKLEEIHEETTIEGEIAEDKLEEKKLNELNIDLSLKKFEETAKESEISSRSKSREDTKKQSESPSTSRESSSSDTDTETTKIPTSEKHKSFQILHEDVAFEVLKDPKETRRVKKRTKKAQTPHTDSVTSSPEMLESSRSKSLSRGETGAQTLTLPSLADSNKLRPESNMSAPNLSSVYSDNERKSAGSNSEDDDVISSASRKRKFKKRAKLRTGSKSAGSDYESSNLIDSGFEPSPRSSRIPKRKVMSERGVNMTTVTQQIQSNIRRYHMERKIFQHLLDLKRLQIRSGQTNEAVLVKRAIDTYHNSIAASVGAGRYVKKDYSYKSFEKFLYQSLRMLQKSPIPVPHIPDNPLLCTQSTHRCLHATHAYTGIPCAAYIPKMNHHTIPKIGFTPRSSFLPQINSKGKSVTLELCHGNDKQVISLPADRLDHNKRYYVTFTVKGHESQSPTDPSATHRHAKSV